MMTALCREIIEHTRANVADQDFYIGAWHWGEGRPGARLCPIGHYARAKGLDPAEVYMQLPAAEDRLFIWLGTPYGLTETKGEWLARADALIESLS